MQITFLNSLFASMLAQLSPDLQNYENSLLSQYILESLVDGVIILTPECKQVYINQSACQICQQIAPNNPNLPNKILRACQAFLKCYRQNSERTIVIESEIVLSKSSVYRMRVRSLQLENDPQLYLVVVLEDCYLSAQNQVSVEVQKYGLTPRQAEVRFLHCLGYSYREIATELYITPDTVKKHVNGFFVKQRELLRKINASE